MADKMTHDTIETLAGRDDLSVAEMVALAEARKAMNPTEERISRNGWTAVIEHHIHSHGKWYATAWRSGTTFSGERCLAGPVDEATARAAAERFLDNPPLRN